MKKFTPLPLSDAKTFLDAQESYGDFLSAREFVVQLGAKDPLKTLSEDDVKTREDAGEFFSIMLPNQSNQKLYPSFQAWPCLQDGILKIILEQLDGLSNSSRYGFFVRIDPFSPEGDVSMIEILKGRLLNGRYIDPKNQTLLNDSEEQRRDFVIQAARCEAMVD